MNKIEIHGINLSGLDVWIDDVFIEQTDTNQEMSIYKYYLENGRHKLKFSIKEPANIKKIGFESFN